MIPFNILISYFIHIRLVPTIRLYTIILENPSPPLGKSIHSIYQLQTNKIYFTLSFQKYLLVDWFHTIYQSAVSFTSYLSPRSDSTLSPIQSDSTLSFSKNSYPPRWFRTINHLVAIWFNWFYFIVSKQLHQTCPHNNTLHYIPYNQTLHYHFGKFPTPLGESIQSIIQLQSDSTDSILSFQNIYFVLVLTSIFYTIPHTIRLYTIIFENSPPF